MKKEAVEKAIPINEELNRLTRFKLPEVTKNHQTTDIEAVVDKHSGDSSFMAFHFICNDYGNYIPVLHNSGNELELAEHEYNQIKDLFNKLISSRIKIQENALEKL